MIHSHSYTSKIVNWEIENQMRPFRSRFFCFCFCLWSVKSIIFHTHINIEGMDTHADTQTLSQAKKTITIKMTSCERAMSACVCARLWFMKSLICELAHFAGRPNWYERSAAVGHIFLARQHRIAPLIKVKCYTHHFLKGNDRRFFPSVKIDTRHTHKVRWAGFFLIWLLLLLK